MGAVHDMSLWDWITANGSAIGAIAGVVAALVAILALVSAAADSRARSQPMITAEFRAAQDSDSAVDFVVANLGQTPARDLTVTFDPPLDIPEDPGNLVAVFIVKRYERPISVLNPGQTLSNTWWRGINTGEPKLVNREPTPDEVTVTVTYRGRGLRHLRDSYKLTIETVSLTTWSVSSSSPKGRLKSIDESLASIRSSLAAVARSLERPDL